MARLLILGALAAAVLTIYAAVDCALTDRTRVATLPRWGWLLLIVLVPVIGPVLWLGMGSGSRSAAAERPLGPDDDPDFLRASGRPAPVVRELDAAEWRSLEQELANLDADAEDDGGDQRR